MAAVQWTDQEWQQKIADKDSVAWQALDQFVENRLKLYAQDRLAWMEGEERAEFVAHCKFESVAQIFHKVGQYQGRGPFLGWCRTVMLSVVIDQVRHDQRRQKRLATNVDIELLPQEQDENALDALEKQLVWQQITPQLAQAVATVLTEQERIVYQAGWERSAKEVATALGMAANNVDQLRFQARPKLRRYLQEKGLTRLLLVEWGVLSGNFSNLYIHHESPRPTARQCTPLGRGQQSHPAIPADQRACRRSASHESPCL